MAKTNHMKSGCHVANELESEIRSQLARFGITLNVSRVRCSGGATGTLHWMFASGKRRLADYWPGTGTLRSDGATRKVDGPREAMLSVLPASSETPDRPAESSDSKRRVRSAPSKETTALSVLPFPDGEYAWICPVEGIYTLGTKWVADMPVALPRVVCGIALDAIEAGLFCRAVTTGRLVDEATMPAGSPVPEAYRRWRETREVQR